MFANSNLDDLAHQISGAVEDDPKNGVFRCRRDVFSDDALFELEMKHVFEGNWIYMRSSTPVLIEVPSSAVSNGETKVLSHAHSMDGPSQTLVSFSKLKIRKMLVIRSSSTRQAATI